MIPSDTFSKNDNKKCIKHQTKFVIKVEMIETTLKFTSNMGQKTLIVSDFWINKGITAERKSTGDRSPFINSYCCVRVVTGDNLK